MEIAPNMIMVLIFLYNLLFSQRAQAASALGKSFFVFQRGGRVE